MTLVDASVTVKTVSVWNKLVIACFRCDNCQLLNTGSATGNCRAKQDPAAWLLDGRALSWLPRRTDKTFADVPAAIASTAREAYSVLAVEAFRAAALLARSVIEATAKDKGITRGRLIGKIDQMHGQGLIREHIRDGAHEVRLLGNEMAHGDFVERVTEEDARLVLTLMEEVLAEVYQSPARVARAKRAREERQQAAAADALSRQALAQLLSGSGTQAWPPMILRQLPNVTATPAVEERATDSEGT